MNAIGVVPIMSITRIILIIVMINAGLLMIVGANAKIDLLIDS